MEWQGVRGALMAGLLVAASAGTAMAQPDAGGISEDAGAPAAMADAGAAADAGGEASDPHRETLRKVQALLAQSKFDEADALVQAVLAVAPNDDRALILRSEVLARTKKMDEALKLLEEAVARPDATAQLMIHLANLHIRNKDQAAGNKILDMVVERFPKDASALVRRAQVVGYSDIDKSSADYKKALELEPDNRAALNNLATLHIARMQFSQAVGLLKKYRELHPAASSGAFNLGSVYYALGMMDEGIALHKELVARNPKDSYAVSQLALGYVLMGNPDEGLKVLADVAAENPRSPMVAHIEGVAWLFKGDAAKAEPLLAEGTRQATRRTLFVMAQIEANRQLGRFAVARKLLERQRGVERDIDAYLKAYEALLVLSETKDQQKASKLLQESIALLPDYKKIEDLTFQLRLPPKAIEDARALLATPATPAADTGKKPAEPRSGCGCAVGQGDGRQAMPWLGLLALLALARRREGAGG